MKRIYTLIILLFCITQTYSQHVNLAPELDEELSMLDFYDKDIVKTLEEYFVRGADLGQSFQHGETLLMKACGANNIPAAKYLIEKGLDPDRMFDDGSGNSLTIAIQQRNPEMVSLLLSGGADVNVQMNRTSVLHEACFFSEDQKMIRILKMLIDAKASINALNSAGYTPLIVAILNGNAEYVKLLIAAGADVNLSQSSDGKSPLKFAVKTGNKNLIAILKKAGAK